MVEVTQADRLEAVRIYQRFRDHDYAKWIGDGTNATGDADSVMQAFARHRIAAAQAERAAAADAMKGPLAWLERWARHIGDCQRILSGNRLWRARCLGSGASQNARANSSKGGGIAA